MCSELIKEEKKWLTSGIIKKLPNSLLKMTMNRTSINKKMMMKTMKKIQKESEKKRGEMSSEKEIDKLNREMELKI